MISAQEQLKKPMILLRISSNYPEPFNYDTLHCWDTIALLEVNMSGEMGTISSTNHGCKTLHSIV